eukprot:jgi/Hompol1/868/HPOL_004433-RA
MFAKLSVSAALLAAAVVSIVQAQQRVWLGCPPSFNTSLQRSGVTTGPCEPADINFVTSYAVQAGARLKVGWDSGNHGGKPSFNLVPLLVPGSILKLTCFGYDDRPGRYAFGNCVHPCNARGGCFFQANVTDNEKFDTTITIPYNLANGDYVIQLAAFVGNSADAVYSCSKITVAGGNPLLNCPAAPTISIPTCVTAAAPDYTALLAGTTPGQFCYSPTGPGNIDDAILEPPVNIDCDPRISCDLSVRPDLCLIDLPTILTPETSPHQNCATVTTTNVFPTATSSSSSSSSTATDSPTPTPTPTTSSTTSSIESTTMPSTTLPASSTATPTASTSSFSSTTPTKTRTRTKVTTTRVTTSRSTKTTSTPSIPLVTSTPIIACGQVFPVIVPGSACSVNSSPQQCSGIDSYAQCAWLETAPGIISSGWVVRQCGQGEGCRMLGAGHPYCDYIE